MYKDTNLIRENVFFSTHNALRNGEYSNDSFLIFLSEVNGQKRKATFPVFPFWDVEMMKRMAIKNLNLSSSTNTSEISIFYNGFELPNRRYLDIFLNKHPKSKVHFQWRFKEGKSYIGIRETELKNPPFLKKIITEINLAFKRGINPKLAMDGTGGTYILSHSNGKHVALFKPKDEEAFAPNNPRNYEGKLGQKGFRIGILSGEGYTREIAAFLLDAHYGGMAGVPQTTLVEVCHPRLNYKSYSHQIVTIELKKKTNTFHSNKNKSLYWKEGSLQEYIDATDTCGDFNPSVFSISDAHFIGILDVFLLNLDRNDGNILVILDHDQTSLLNRSKSRLTPEGTVSKYRLIPIDHGLTLPDSIYVEDIDLVWFYWPHTKIPFSESELHYIDKLDPDKDAIRLRKKLDIREECLRTMRVTTRVLKIAAKMHLNLYQIASLIVRVNDVQLPSITEKAIKYALLETYIILNPSSCSHLNLFPLCLVDWILPKSHALLLSTKIPLSKNVTTDTNHYFNESFEMKEKGSIFYQNEKNIKNISCLTDVIQNDSKNSYPQEHVKYLSNIEPCKEKSSLSLDSSSSDTYINQLMPVDSSISNSYNVSSILNNVKGSSTNSYDRIFRSYVNRKKSTKMISTSRRYNFTSNYTWSLEDKNQQYVLLDWGNPLLENVFFKTFESIIKKLIIIEHPQWSMYHYNG